MSKWLKRGAALIIVVAVYITPPEWSNIYFVWLGVSLVLTSWICLGSFGLTASSILTLFSGGTFVAALSYQDGSIVTQTLGNVLVSISAIIAGLKWRQIILKGPLNDAFDMTIGKLLEKDNFPTRFFANILMFTVWALLPYAIKNVWDDTRWEAWGLYIWFTNCSLMLLFVTKLIWPKTFKNIFVETKIGFPTFVAFLVASVPFVNILQGLFDGMVVQMDTPSLIIIAIATNIVGLMIFRLISYEPTKAVWMPKITLLSWVLLLGSGAVWLLVTAFYWDQALANLANAFLALSIFTASAHLIDVEPPWRYLERISLPTWIEVWFRMLYLMTLAGLATLIVVDGELYRLWFFPITAVVVAKHIFLYLSWASNLRLEKNS